MYQYTATIERWIDGDTAVLMVDLGFRVFHRQHIRLAGFDAPEVRGEERPEGLKIKAFCELAFPPGSQVLLHATDRDKYGRYVGTLKTIDEIEERDGIDINYSIEVEVGRLKSEDREP